MLDRFGLDHGRNPQGYALALGLAILTIGAFLHAFLGAVSAFESLYILPIWVATRIGGTKVGGAVAFVSAVVTTALDSRAMGANVWLPSLGLHLASYGFVVVFVSEVESALARQQLLARTDPLTGLANRRALSDEGQLAVDRARKFSRPVVVAMIDCNDFKRLNDLHGHQAGDHVLKILARTLEIGTRTTDFVARVGGDEFAVILPETEEVDAYAIMSRVEKAFELATRNAGYFGSFSVGLAPLSEANPSLEAMLASADKAMFQNKGRKSRAFLD